MRRDFRWLGFGLSALLHGGVALAVLSPGGTGEPVEIADAPLLELELSMFAPAPTQPPAERPAPAVDEPERQPEPVLEPEPEPEPEPRIEPKPEPEPEPEPQLEPDRVPEPKPLPEPKPAPEPKPVPRPQSQSMKQPPDVRQLPQVTASQPVATRPLPAPPAPDPERLARIEQDYLARLAALIERHRFYPRTSRRLREEGTVVLRLVLAQEGRFAELAVAESSGMERLDRAALETLEKVARFDPIPADLGRTRWSISVPISYRLR